MKQATRILFMILRPAIAIGLLAYLGISGTFNGSMLLGLMSGWSITLMALILLLLVVGVTAWRLCVLLKAKGLHLSLLDSIRLTLIGLFFNACMPGANGGDVVKIYYATKGNRGRRTEVTIIMLADRATGMFALVIWPLLVAPLFPQMVGTLKFLHGLLWTAAVTALVMVVGLLIGCADYIRNSRLVAWAFQRLPLGSYLEKTLDTVYTLRHNPISLLTAVGLSLASHSMSIGAVLLIAQAINPDGATWRMIALIPFGLLVNTLPVTPGGLGVGEIAFDRLFSIAGLARGAETVLGWRLLTILISLIGLVFYLQARNRFVYES